jgi:hypothetical protein
MNSRRFTAAPKLRTGHRNGYPYSFKQGNVPCARGPTYARIDKNNLAGRTTGSSEGAVTVAGAMSDTFARIAPGAVIAFIVAQMTGMVAGLFVGRWLWGQADIGRHDFHVR